jgi:hypothetical protein
MFKSDSFTRRAPPAVWRYGLAIVSVAMALGITLSLEPYTTLRTPFLYAAILITTWFGGIGPGLLAVTLATPALGYYFGPPIRRTLAAEAVDVPFILFFSLLAFLITWLSAKRKGMVLFPRMYVPVSLVRRRTTLRTGFTRLHSAL